MKRFYDAFDIANHLDYLKSLLSSEYNIIKLIRGAVSKVGMEYNFFATRDGIKTDSEVGKEIIHEELMQRPHYLESGDPMKIMENLFSRHRSLDIKDVFAARNAIYNAVEDFPISDISPLMALLIKETKSATPASRYTAAEAIGKISSKIPQEFRAAALEALIDKHVDYYVGVMLESRESIYNILEDEQTSPIAILDVLLKGAESASNHARFTSAQGLGKISTKLIEEAPNKISTVLRKLFEQHDDLQGQIMLEARESIFQIVAQDHEPKIIRLLTDKMTDPVEQARITAAMTLDKISDKIPEDMISDVIKVLFDLHKEDYYIVNEGARPAIYSLLSHIPDAKVVDVLNELFIRTKSSSEYARFTATEGITRLAHRIPEEKIKDALNILLKQHDDTLHTFVPAKKGVFQIVEKAPESMSKILSDIFHEYNDQLFPKANSTIEKMSQKLDAYMNLKNSLKVDLGDKKTLPDCLDKAKAMIWNCWNDGADEDHVCTNENYIKELSFCYKDLEDHHNSFDESF